MVGFNVVDLPTRAQTLQLPCIAVMRKLPDLVAFDKRCRICLTMTRGNTLLRGLAKFTAS